MTARQVSMRCSPRSLGHNPRERCRQIMGPTSRRCPQRTLYAKLRNSSSLINFRSAAQGLVVFRVSVWFMVPSGFWVIVFSLVLTVPFPLTRVSSVLEMVRAHPAVRPTPRPNITAQVISLRLLMCFMQIIYCDVLRQALGRNPCPAFANSIPFRTVVVPALTAWEAV